MASSFFDLHGTAALVTGGNSGIGLGMARGLAAAGADVAIWGTSEAKNHAAAAELEELGGRVVALACDVGDEDRVEEAFAETVARLGGLDACFANAGVSGRAPSFLEMTLDEWHRVLRVNLDGAFLTLRAAARCLVGQGRGGSLVATASLAAVEGQARGQHYAATKGGLVSMMKALAVELARYGVRANTILPGWVETPMTEPAFAWDRFREKVLPRVPVRRWGVPDDFAGIACYLASGASTYHTADTFVIDGGYSVF
ncbi:MAG TPA: SDR family NAD(P)-dependent oxidoreductase [Acidimicrobiales bacterium]|nr:SDR family NAD(P)-dependent oxidoreductase [Acidimicrobiales bacterium]